METAVTESEQTRSVWQVEVWTEIDGRGNFIWAVKHVDGYMMPYRMKEHAIRALNICRESYPRGHYRIVRVDTTVTRVVEDL